MNSPVQITDARPALRPMEVAALGVAAVVATPGLTDAKRVELIRAVLRGCRVP